MLADAHRVYPACPLPWLYAANNQRHAGEVARPLWGSAVRAHAAWRFANSFNMPRYAPAGRGSICPGVICHNCLNLNGYQAADGDGCAVQGFPVRQTNAEEQTPYMVLPFNVFELDPPGGHGQAGWDG